MASKAIKVAPHPEPAADFLSLRLPIRNYKNTVWRFSEAGKSPLYFLKEDLHRFNAPNREFGISYYSESIRGAFCERFLWMTGKKQVSWAEVEKNHLAVFEIVSPLQLVDLTGKGLARIGADGRLCITEEYSLSQRWSLAIWSNPQKVDGVLYGARHDPSQRSIALYERAKGKLKLTRFSMISWADLDACLKLYKVELIY